MKFKRKPKLIEATQWFKNGDHPEDDREEFIDSETGKPFLGEGKVVRYFRHPDISGSGECSRCGDIMHNHGWIDNSYGGHTVCPGDWIIMGRDGWYPVAPHIFEQDCERVE